MEVHRIPRVPNIEKNYTLQKSSEWYEENEVLDYFAVSEKKCSKTNKAMKYRF